MSRVNFLNPVRRLAGRLFLWFWSTLIVTALLAVWISQIILQPVEVDIPNPRALGQLHAIIGALEKSNTKFGDARQMIQKIGRDMRRPMIILDVETQKIILENGPPLRPETRDLVFKYAQHSGAMQIVQGPIELIGPGKFYFNNKEYALFLQRPPKFLAGPEDMLVWIIPCAILISGVFCWVFAKSIVRPIRHLQSTGRRLANGEWQARNDMKQFGRDEIGELATDFNRMAEQLQRLWQGQKRLLGDISHELRSPLARMQMAIGLAHQQDVENKTLDRIEREAVRMDALISQLLTLTRAETGSASLEPSTLPRVFTELFQDTGFEASNVGKSFRCETIPDTEVMVNVEQIQSAVENVLRNAIRYAESEIVAEFQVTNSAWQLIISDDGSGLNQQECDAIFQPFYRPSTSRERQSGGVGLGLAIAQAAVDLHKGTIVAKPGESGGLQVTFNVPLGTTE